MALNIFLFQIAITEKKNLTGSIRLYLNELDKIVILGIDQNVPFTEEKKKTIVIIMMIMICVQQESQMCYWQTPIYWSMRNTVHIQAAHNYSALLQTTDRLKLLKISTCRYGVTDDYIAFFSDLTGAWFPLQMTYPVHLGTEELVCGIHSGRQRWWDQFPAIYTRDTKSFVRIF